MSEHASTTLRWLDRASVLSYALLLGWLVVRLEPHVHQRPWLRLTAALLGYLASDLVSGFVHWAADTWGSSDAGWRGRAPAAAGRRPTDRRGSRGPRPRARQPASMSTCSARSTRSPRNRALSSGMRSGRSVT
jgi:hypothetical protein